MTERRFRERITVRRGVGGNIIIECGPELAAIIGSAFANSGILDEVVRNIECVKAEAGDDFYISAMSVKSCEQRMGELAAMIAAFADEVTLFQSFGLPIVLFSVGKVRGEIRTVQSIYFIAENKRYLELIAHTRKDGQGRYISLVLNSDPAQAAETVMRVVQLLDGDE